MRESQQRIEWNLMEHSNWIVQPHVYAIIHFFFTTHNFLNEITMANSIAKCYMLAAIRQTLFVKHKKQNNNKNI